MRSVPDKETLGPYYFQWLEGVPLRTLAQRFTRGTGIPVSYGKLSNWFNSAYGAGATSPLAMSLQRSMLEDYPDNPVVRQWVLDNLGTRSDTKHRSRHSIKQLTVFQTARTDTVLEYMVPTGNDPWDQLDPSFDPASVPQLSWLLLTLSALVQLLERLTHESLLPPVQPSRPPVPRYPCHFGLSDVA